MEEGVSLIEEFQNADPMDSCSVDGNNKACIDMFSDQSWTETVPCNVKILLRVMELMFQLLTKIWSILYNNVSS